MNRKLLFSLLAALAAAGCSIDEVEKSGSPCSPTVEEGGYVTVGDITCYSDRMTGKCIDKQGNCILTDECDGCADDYAECMRYQADFDKLVANSKSVNRRYVTSVNGKTDLSEYDSMMIEGNLNKCPAEAPYCVWGPDGDGLKFGCIECSKTVCGMDCVDLMVTSAHCGACGHACPDGVVCREGRCDCPQNTVYCSGECIDPASDTRYCGAYGSCTDSEAGVVCTESEICKEGVCVEKEPEVVVCEPGEHLYTVDGKNNCEADSLDNCGSHGNACKVIEGWANGTCKAGECIASECNVGFHVKDGACEIDTAECCGDACEKCGEGLLCSEGICTVICAPDETECSSEKGEAYCADITSSMNDCGQCGNKCLSENVPNSETVKCKNSECIADTCAKNYYYADGGCYANNIFNCGKLGFDCSSVVPGWQSGTCTEGKCKLEKCKENNHLNSETQACEEDTNVCCGDECVDCSKKNMVCSGGECTDTCSETETSCMVDDVSMCADLKTSMTHCGQCGHVCNAAGVAHSVSTICDNSQCKAVSCAEEYHLLNGACEIDSPEHCGSHDIVCNVEYADNYCKNKECSFECTAGYHKDKTGEKCEADSETSCGVTREDCTLRKGWGSGSCTGGQCSLEKCKESYHLNSTKQTCEEDTNICCGDGCVDCSKKNMVCSEGACTDNCGPAETSCMVDDVSVCAVLSSSMLHCGECGRKCDISKVAHSSSTICEGSQCKASKCVNGYHLKNGTCDTDTLTDCGVLGNACTVANAENKCINGTCNFTCNAGYHENGSTCEKDDNNNCGSHGTACTADLIPGSTEVKCTNGKCEAKTCNADHHIFEGICEANDNNNCGSHGTACTVESIPGSNAVKCTNGKCEAKACAADYHIYEGRCEANDDANCGVHGAACNTGTIPGSTAVKCTKGKCEAKSCAADYHIYEGICEADDDANCGVHGAVCNTETIPGSKAVICTKGKCKAESCAADYHIYENICEADDNNNCGIHGRICNVYLISGAASVNCENGKCAAVSCASDYHKYNGLCEMNSMEHCGAHESVCNVQRVSHSTSVNCDKGYCEASACEKGYTLKSGTCKSDKPENNCPKGMFDCHDGRCCQTLSACTNHDAICMDSNPFQ